MHTEYRGDNYMIAFAVLLNKLYENEHQSGLYLSVGVSSRECCALKWLVIH